MTCPVCFSEYNTRTRKPVKCAYCDYTMCVDCLKSYLLTVADDPKCMSCARGFTDDHLESMTNKTFIKNEFRKAAIKVLMDRERSLLPDTLEKFEVTIQLQKIHKRVVLIRSKVHAMRRELNHSDRLARLVDISRGLHEEITSLNEEQTYWYRIEEEQRRARKHTNPHDDHDHKASTAASIHFCASPSCEGVLSSSHKCLTCGARHCKKCMAVICNGTENFEARMKEHTCKESDLLTAEALKRDTKPCPSCKVRIHKIMGCDQMFCTRCNTVFDWATLRKLNGPVHNPHYFDYLASIHRTLPDDYEEHEEVVHTTRTAPNCGESPEIPDYFFFKFREIHDKFHKVHALHLRSFALACNELYSPPVPGKYEYTPETYQHLRIAKLFDGLTDQEWQRRLLTEETKRQRDISRDRINETFVAAGRDIIHRLNEKVKIKDFESTDEERRKKAEEDLEQFHEEAHGLRRFYNRALCILKKRHSMSKDHYISPTFEFNDLCLDKDLFGEGFTQTKHSCKIARSKTKTERVPVDDD